MVDFNTKKNILKKLRKVRSENKLLWLPCVIAAAFVKLWYGTACRIGMALSDRNGNFLGIKMSERKSDSRKVRRQVRRQDDIVYVKKPFIGRIMSVVLAAAFVLMVAPELNIDLGIRASAIDLTNTETYGGDSIVRTNPTSTDAAAQYILEKDGKFANSETITPGTYHTSDSAIYITWESYNLPNRVTEYNNTTGAGIDVNNFVPMGYTILVLSEAGGSWASPLRCFSVNNGTSFLINKESTDVYGSKFSDFNPDMPYYIVVLPRFRIQKYIKVREPTTETDESGNPKFREYMQKLLEDKYYDLEYRVTDIGGGDCIYSAVVANAKLEAPVLQITDNNDYTISRPYSYSTKNNLKWNKVKQIENTGKTDPNYGGEDAGLPATGYRLFVSKDNGNFVLDNSVTMVEDGDSITCEYVCDAGRYYRFFVEAYKDNWSNNDGTGTVTSKSNTLDLYIAPVSPGIEAKLQRSSSGNGLFYEIYIKENSKATYDGIYLMRTTDKKLDYESVDKAVLGGKPYGQWLYKTAIGENTDAESVKIRQEFDLRCVATTLPHDDYDNIVEGRKYYYYAVAFKEIETDGAPDYLLARTPTTTLNPGDFDLTIFKKTKPSQPKLDITDDQITVNWEAINGNQPAESYEIEIVQTGVHNDKNENEKLSPYKNLGIKPADTNKYLHTGLNYSDSYRYRVRGVVHMKTLEPTPVPKRKANGEIERDENGNKIYETDARGNIVYEKDENGNIIYNEVDDIHTEWSDWVEGTVGTRIGTPTISDVVSADGQLTVKWTAVSGAAGYYLEYENINNSNDKGTITVDNGSTSHVHRNLKNGNVYRYRVCAYKEIKIPGKPKESQLVSGNYSDWYTPVRVGDELLIPQNLKLTTKDGEITATWNPVKGATGYILYSKKDGTYGEPDEFRVSGITFTQTGLVNGDVYTYQVRAVKRVNGEDDPSELSTPASIKVGEELTTPQNLKATTKDGEITISWTPVGGAKGYKLWYRKAGSGTFTSIDVTKSPFTHTGLNNGDVYEYYVVAYKEVNGKTIPGPESVTIKQMVGSVLDTPKDFTVTANDGKADLKWTAVKGAEGYIIHASSGGRYYQFDVSKVTYTHSDLSNGDVWTYYVTAYKTVNGTRTYSNPSEPRTVTIGISLNSAVDLTATAGNRQIDLKWTAVKGAEGYVVYLYNSKTMEFEPITLTSKTSYSHVGLKNGKQYTYMVAPYKNINGKRYYGDYSLSVTAIPTTGSITDIDHELKVKGTAPYGISHGEYIKATSNHGAFDESVDVYFTTNRKSTQAVKDVLKNYANGLSSFIIYPFDISIYRENTHIEVDPADGYTVTITMPVPDRLIAYRDYITVVHIGDGVYEAEEMNLAEDWLDNYDRRLEVLPCAIVDIDNVWCVQFKCSDFSPFALVIYKEHIQDVASGGGLLGGDFADTFNSGVLLFTALPDIMPHNRKLRIVQSGSKRYRIKSVTRR